MDCFKRSESASAVFEYSVPRLPKVRSRGADGRKYPGGGASGNLVASKDKCKPTKGSKRRDENLRIVCRLLRRLNQWAFATQGSASLHLSTL